MAKVIILDSGPLGRITHPQANLAIVRWLTQLRATGATIIVPEIADYEVRRELIRIGATRSIARLNQLKTTLVYMPLTTDIMLRAAQLWASARRQGRPTADPRELDGDVILAAQALVAGAIVATENVGHLSLFVPADNWANIS